MIYDLFYASFGNIDNDRWLSFKAKFPTAQKFENLSSYTDIKNSSFTKQFWVVWDDIDLVDDFDFSYKSTKWDDQYIHVFKNGLWHDGVTLFTKNTDITTREFKNRFYIK